MLAAGLGAEMFAVEPRRVQVTRHDVRVPGLGPALDGLRIAQVADVHLPANRAAVDRAAALLAAERPEIVVLTGDQCEVAEGVGELVAFVREVRGTVATLAVLGNWDYRGGTVGDVARRAYAEAGATLLVNEHAIVSVGGAGLAFVGVDDVLSGRADLRAAAAGVSDDASVIAVVHEPGVADEPIPAGVAVPAFTLSGHTHGGQIRSGRGSCAPPSSLSSRCGAASGLFSLRETVDRAPGSKQLVKVGVGVRHRDGAAAYRARSQLRVIRLI